MEDSSGTELTSKLTEHLKEILSDTKVKATVVPPDSNQQAPKPTVVAGLSEHCCPQRAHTRSLWEQSGSCASTVDYLV